MVSTSRAYRSGRCDMRVITDLVECRRQPGQIKIQTRTSVSSSAGGLVVAPLAVAATCCHESNRITIIVAFESPLDFVEDWLRQTSNAIAGHDPSAKRNPALPESSARVGSTEHDPLFENLDRTFIELSRRRHLHRGVVVRDDLDHQACRRIARNQRGPVKAPARIASAESIRNSPEDSPLSMLWHS